MTQYILTDNPTQVIVNGHTLIPDGSTINNESRFWKGDGLVECYQDFLNGGGTPEPYIEPPTPIPTVITMRQARLALLSIGKLADVEAIIAGMPGTEGEAARIEWEYAQTVKRDHALVVNILPSLGLTEVEIDELFLTASVV